MSAAEAAARSSGEEAGESLLASVRTGRYLDAQVFGPLAWAVPGLVPEGMGFLTGAPKLGKSWCSLDIALAVAGGGYALGEIPTGPPRPVLLLALEDGERRLQSRCRLLLGDEPIPGLLHYLTAATPDRVIPIIRAWLAEHGDRQPLVVLDTLGKVMPLAMAGESAYQRDYRIGGVLKELVEDHPGSTLLVVHHVRKAASVDWMDSTSGTNGLNGSADFTVNMTRERGEPSGLVRVVGRDIEREGEYAVMFSGGRWNLAGADLDEAAAAAEQARASEGLGDDSAAVVALVSQRPEGVQAADVAEALGWSEAKSRTYLARAAKSGRITRAGRGLYTPVASVASVTSEDPNATLATHATGPLGGDL